MESYKIALSRYRLSQKIPGGHSFWREFNASFDNVEMSTDLILQRIYEGHAITTQHKNHWRTSENYQLGQHIGLDFDQGDKSSSIDSLKRDPFILKYGAFVYSTMSHTEECPRTRVIFTLDTPIVQAKNYTLAAQSLLWLYGTADRQCKDAVRFFYGSPNCQYEYIGSVLPLETIKKLIAQYQETGNGERKRASHKDYAVPADQNEVKAALDCIPPWSIDYDEWVQVLMGIHAQFGEAGLGMAEGWAQGGKGEVEHKWRSFDQAGNTQGAVTIATVFGIAKRFGWSKEYAHV